MSTCNRDNSSYWASYLSDKINKLFCIVFRQKRDICRLEVKVSQLSNNNGGEVGDVTPTANATTLPPGSQATASVTVTN